MNHNARLTARPAPLTLAMVAVGPVANALGQEETLLLAAGAFFVLQGTTAALPSVRAIRREAAAGRPGSVPS